MWFVNFRLFFYFFPQKHSTDNKSLDLNNEKCGKMSLYYKSHLFG